MKKLLLSFLMLMGTSPAFAACKSLYNFQFTTLQGEEIDLCKFQDQPILVVNTASKCGFSPQFGKLETMYKKYRDRGLLIVGFPSNDFQQELATNKDIGDFCKKNYGVHFPMAEKSSIVGPDANALYKQLIHTTNEPPMWNFYKYLILPNEEVYTFSSDTEPESSQIMGRLQPYLK